MTVDLLRFQREQHAHDKRNHSDILTLCKNDRLKHYGLHFAKYVGRLARGADEPKSLKRTIIDTCLVSLSAANTLHQKLDESQISEREYKPQIGSIYAFADAAGRFADACEKIDHLEEFVQIARKANEDVMDWVLTAASERQINLEEALCERRKELAERQFYVVD